MPTGPFFGRYTQFSTYESPDALRGGDRSWCCGGLVGRMCFLHRIRKAIRTEVSGGSRTVSESVWPIAAASEL
jgi:hypothetical protein